jgi:SET domain-containing protein
MQQLPGLYIAETKDKGRGVFTAYNISKDDVIEVCPVITIPQSQVPIIHKTILHDYYFLWGNQMTDAAIALGYGSLYNHEVHANANFILDVENMTIDIVAIRDIISGEEITINYNGEPGDDGQLWF